MAQSIERLATGCSVRRLNPGGGEIFRTPPDWPWVFPRGKAAGAWRWLPTTPSADVKERVEPLLPLWTVVVCSRENFAFYLHFAYNILRVKSVLITQNTEKSFISHAQYKTALRPYILFFFKLEYISYWSQIRDCRLSPAQTTARLTANSSVSITEFN